MEKKNELITNEIKNFPEFENIRNVILEAREKVATTVNTAMVAAYWTIGKQLYDAQNGTSSTYGKKLIKFAYLINSKVYTIRFRKCLAEDASYFCCENRFTRFVPISERME